MLAALCNDPITLEVVRCLSFRDAKRPVTKGLLQRIDLSAILDRVDHAELAARAEPVLREDLGLAPADRAPMAGEIERLQHRDDPSRPERPTGLGRPTVTPRSRPIERTTPWRSPAINYHSRSLQKASSFNVVFPDDPAVPRPWSVFYLLHGLSDDHTIWMRRTSIERYVDGPAPGRRHARRRPGLVHQRRRPGYAYEDDLIKDVVGLVDRTFPVKAERAGRAIGGLSMGGYGAVKLGLKHHELFASVNSHSGALGLLHDDRPKNDRIKDISPEFERIFGTAGQGRARRPVRASSRRSTTAGSPRSGSTAARTTS